MVGHVLRNKRQTAERVLKDLRSSRLDDRATPLATLQPSGTKPPASGPGDSFGCRHALDPQAYDAFKAAPERDLKSLGGRDRERVRPSPRLGFSVKQTCPSRLARLLAPRNDGPRRRGATSALRFRPAARSGHHSCWLVADESRFGWGQRLRNRSDGFELFDRSGWCQHDAQIGIDLGNDADPAFRPAP